MNNSNIKTIVKLYSLLKIDRTAVSTLTQKIFYTFKKSKNNGPL